MGNENDTVVLMYAGREWAEMQAFKKKQEFMMLYEAEVRKRALLNATT